MIPVFNTPVVADGGGELLGGGSHLADVERDLIGGMPEAGFGVLALGEAGD